MPTPRIAFLAVPICCAALTVVFPGCGGSVANSSDGGGRDDGAGVEDTGRHGSGDAGADSGPSGDASVPDGGCVANPTEGAACAPSEQACQMGDPCCIGYVWECSSTTHTWTKDGLGCACQIDAGGKDAATEVPVNHRADDSQCAGSPPPGNCPESIPMDVCSHDTDCTTGTNGRCVESGGGALDCSCTYDTCATDNDCPKGQLCACHGSPYTESAGNTCMPGNCRVDADCGASGYCSPSEGGGCGSLGGYYCHTPSDQCVNDSDCSGGGLDVCEWSSTDARWECQMELLCG
jgi:hypothetical protein